MRELQLGAKNITQAITKMMFSNSRPPVPETPSPARKAQPNPIGSPQA
jgi:hypothetical protein